MVYFISVLASHQVMAIRNINVACAMSEVPLMPLNSEIFLFQISHTDTQMCVPMCVCGEGAGRIVPLL